MSTNDKYRSVFKRVETDDEFRARLRAMSIYSVVVETKATRIGYYGIPVSYVDRKFYSLVDLKGEALDDAVWSARKLQRRIVEDVTK